MAGVARASSVRGVEPARVSSLVLRVSSPLAARLRGRLPAGGEIGAARRLAGGAFAVRVVNAGLGFVTQIALARWMGDTQYGIYAYLWVWVLTLGATLSLGLPVAALKFIPDYTHRGDLAGLRGFLNRSRTLAILPSLVASALAALALTIAYRLAGSPGAYAAYWAAALVALATLPVYVLTDMQTGIARAYDFADLGLAADYVLRPLLLLALAGLLILSGVAASAVAVMLATFAAVLVTAALQGIVLQGRIAARVPPGPVRADTRRWAGVAGPLLAVTGCTVLLSSVDVIALKLFVGPEAIARYFAATKITAIASFVAYGVAATSSHRFALHMASGDREAARRLAAETVRWSFWPTLGVIAVLLLLGRPLLSLFGADYAGAWPVLAILSVGLLAQAAVGPADRALAMMEESGVAARIFAVAVAVNLAGALLLAPLLGTVGAALATAGAMVVRSALLAANARSRLGLDMVIWARDASLPATQAAASSAVQAELVPLKTALQDEEAWEALARTAIEPNAFYAPAMVAAGFRHLPEGQGAVVLRAWRPEADGSRRLVGLLPLVRPRGRTLNPLPIRRAASLYGTVSTPLLAPDAPAETVAALLDAAGRAGLVGLLLPFARGEGPVANALREAAERRGGGVAELKHHRRALLASPLPGADYLRATLDTKRRKEADRQRRRLAELGELRARFHATPEAVAAALPHFLAVEASGWKGRLGTDLARAAETFIRAATAGMAQAGAMRIATLELDGRAVAAGLVLIGGRRAFYFKTAYDETYARFSPGLLLTLDLTAHLLDDPAIDEADSIAVADHAMIDRVWTGRFAIAALLVSSGRPGLRFRLAIAAERVREAVRLRTARLRVKLSGWRQGRVRHAARKRATAPVG